MYIVYDRIFGNFLAKNAVHTTYIYIHMCRVGQNRICTPYIIYDRMYGNFPTNNFIYIYRIYVCIYIYIYRIYVCTYGFCQP